MTVYGGPKDGGYLLIDHTFSPGLPEGIARATGLDPQYVGEGKKLEAATLTCSHCKCAVVKNPLRLREREKCQKCGWHYICDLCAAAMRQPDYSHTPYDKKVDLNVTRKLIEEKLGSPTRLILPDEPA